jgi:hypothetical protein
MLTSFLHFASAKGSRLISPPFIRDMYIYQLSHFAN